MGAAPNITATCTSFPRAPASWRLVKPPNQTSGDVLPNMSPPLLPKGPLHVLCGPSMYACARGVGRLGEGETHSGHVPWVPWRTASPQLRKRRPPGLRLGPVVCCWPHSTRESLILGFLGPTQSEQGPTRILPESWAKLPIFSCLSLSRSLALCLTWAMRGYDGGTVGEGSRRGCEARLQKGIFVPSSFRYG